MVISTVNNALFIIDQMTKMPNVLLVSLGVEPSTIFFPKQLNHLSMQELLNILVRIPI